MTTYRIVPKRDFGSGKGFWLPGVPGGKGTDSYGFVKSGFVVTDGLCNVMPGATWFRTVADAMKAIEIYASVRGVASDFWQEWRAHRGTPHTS